MRNSIKYIIALLVLAIVGYGAFVKYGPVKSFPTNAEVAKALKIKEENILDVYELSERHRYVAYVNNNVAQQSFWAFHNRKWQQASNYMGHEIMVVNTGDEKTIAWNLKGEGMHTLNIFAIIERNAQLTTEADGTMDGQYFPQIVLKQSIEIDANSSHGVFPLPEQWYEALKRRPETSEQIQQFSFFSNEDIPSYQWEVRDVNGKVVQTNRPSGTSGTTDLGKTGMTFDYVSHYESYEDLHTATNYVEELGYTIEVLTQQDILTFNENEMYQTPNKEFWAVQQIAPENYIGKDLSRFIFIVKNHPLAEEVQLAIVVDGDEVIGGTSFPHSEQEPLTGPYFSLDGTPAEAMHDDYDAWSNAWDEKYK